MSFPQSDPRKQIFSVNQAMGYILGVSTILLPSISYWQLGSSLFGQSPLTKLLLITCIGGAVSSAFYAGRRRWLIGSVLGLVAGLGAPSLLLFYTTIFRRHSMWTGEIGLLQLAGAGPSMALLGMILRRDQQKSGTTDAS